MHRRTFLHRSEVCQEYASTFTGNRISTDISTSTAGAGIFQPHHSSRSTEAAPGKSHLAPGDYRQGRFASSLDGNYGSQEHHVPERRLRNSQHETCLPDRGARFQRNFGHRKIRKRHRPRYRHADVQRPRLPALRRSRQLTARFPACRGGSPAFTVAVALSSTLSSPLSGVLQSDPNPNRLDWREDLLFLSFLFFSPIDRTEGASRM